MKKKAVAVGLAVAGLMVLAACTSSSDDTTTTTHDPMTTTSEPNVETTTTTVAETTTTTQINQLTPPEYEIVSQAALDEGGNEVVVLLDPTSYQSLTDLDIYDIIAEVVDENPSTSILHVVDSSDAADVLANPESSSTDPSSLDNHYLARLENGTDITYLGPFASSGEAVLGS